MRATLSLAERGMAAMLVVLLTLLVTSSALACQGTNRQYRQYTLPWEGG